MTEIAATMDTNDVAAQPPGVRLRRAREERDLSREGVAARLKLDVATIAVLERGELARLGAPVFALGYLRAYARLLELPADELIAGFGHPEGLSAPSLDPAGSPVGADLGRMSAGRGGGPWKRVVVSVVVLALLAAGVALWDRVDESVPAVVALAPVTIFRETTKTEEEVPPAVHKDEPAADEAGVELAGEATTVLPGLAADEAASVEIQTHTGDNDDNIEPRAQLVLFFSQDSWVEVRDARGEPLLIRLGRAGTTHSMDGVAPFEVQLGYAPGVDITYNGAPFDMTRYAARRTAHFRVSRAGDVNEAGND